ncbi:hypothetical protein [Falsiphaeobacter marinintestinus]|uniref:hypothetical protein n=1 Tax=Falsiphaeobacter marinintestinus TaxID=1492905 RepID=UPI0011B43519|nr:hypothetical protein [Phaeobacter marinintestinus]
MTMHTNPGPQRHAQLFELLRQKSLADQVARRIKRAERNAPSRGDTTMLKMQALRSLQAPRPSHA